MWFRKMNRLIWSKTIGLNCLAERIYWGVLLNVGLVVDQLEYRDSPENIQGELGLNPTPTALG
jgi:hypothetical protein